MPDTPSDPGVPPLKPGAWKKPESVTLPGWRGTALS
jgi:hypothetical protein